MIRIVVQNIILFLLPTVVYVAYVYMTKEDKPGGARVFDDAPIIWLFTAGVVVVLVTLIAFGSISGGKPGQVYTPPVLKDGRIEPGHLD